MKKKILAMPLLVIGMAFFVQCSDETFSSEADRVIILAGKGGGGGGGHTEPVGNNLSFPVFAVDGFSISTIANPSWQTIYSGPYTGLSAEELAIVSTGDWYAQKVVGNVWQADFSNADAPKDITFIDWGDVIESVNPVIGRPFRLETTLYVDISAVVPQMTGYTMAMLANPSSPNEIQGTNKGTYLANWATVASTSPTLIIQFLEDGAVPDWSQEFRKMDRGWCECPSREFQFRA